MSNVGLHGLAAGTADQACLHMQYFDDMDHLYEHACEMESDMELAVHAEQYEEAAKLKKEYEELRKKDLVDALLTVSLPSQLHWRSSSAGAGVAGKSLQFNVISNKRC